MIRISFTKIEFSQNTTASHIQMHIQSQNAQSLIIKQKKVKNNLSRFYGDFVQFQTNNLTLWLKIYGIEQGKQSQLIQKTTIKRNTYGYNMKKSHTLQTKKLKIWFDSQKISYDESSYYETSDEFSDLIGNGFVPLRLNQMKTKRGFSPVQKYRFQKQQSLFNDSTDESSRNTTMVKTVKNPIKDLFTTKI